MPFATAINSEDFEGKKVSLKLTLLLLLITAFAVYEGSYIYFRFENLEKEAALVKHLHAQDIEHLTEKMQYERDRVDRKFKQLEK